MADVERDHREGGAVLKVAVIGATGQLGGDIVEAFGDSAIPLSHADVEVTDPKSLEVLRSIKPDVIVNTAAFHKTDECERNPEKAFSVNTIGAINVAKVAKEIGAINVYISTDYVFDGQKGAPYSETDVPNPINVYGLSKYAGELATANFSGKYYIIRVASLFGVRGARGKGGNFVETMIRKARTGENIKVVDDMVMSPTFTKDAAHALKKLLDMLPPWGVYHVVNEGACSWYEFARKIFEILGVEVKIEPIKTKDLNLLAKRPPCSALSVRKIKSLGIGMRHWEDALKAYLKSKGHIR